MPSIATRAAMPSRILAIPKLELDIGIVGIIQVRGTGERGLAEVASAQRVLVHHGLPSHLPGADAHRLCRDGEGADCAAFSQTFWRRKL